MLSGLNTDIQYKGEVYHVQTEDSGAANPVITTLLFKGGAIFSSKKTSYAELLQSDSYQEAVRERMKEQHKNMVRELAAGKFERASGSSGPQEGKEEDQKEVKAAPPSPVPSKFHQKKSLDDLILDYLSDKEETLD